MSNERFTEVIQMVFDSAEAERDLRQYVTDYKKNLDDLRKAGDITAKEYVATWRDANAAQVAIEAAAQRERVKILVDAAKEKLAIEAQTAANISKINSDLVRADIQRYKEEEAANSASVDRQMATFRSAEAEKTAAAEKRAAQILKINTLIARESAAADQEITRENAAAVEKQMAEDRKRVANIAKINSEILQSDRQRLREEERENAASVEKQMALMRREAAEKASVNAKLVRNQIAITRPGAVASAEASAATATGMAGVMRGGLSATGLSMIAPQAAIASQALEGLGASFAGVAIAAAAIVPPIMMLSHSSEFTKKLSEMSTLLEAATDSGAHFAQVLHDTAEAAVDLSIKFNRDLIETVEGFKEALSSGIDANQLVAFSEKAGTLSAALNISFRESANILTTFKDTYKLSINDLDHVNSVLFNTINVGKIVGSDFVKQFGRVASIAEAARLPLEDVAGAFATFTREGIPSSRAITSLTSLIEHIINPSQKAQKAFHELGLEFGQGALAQGLPAFIEQVKSLTGGDLDKLAKLFPDNRALLGISAMTNATEKLRENTEAVRENGTAQVAQARALDNGVVKFEQLGKVISGEFALAGRDLWNSLASIFLGDGPLDGQRLKDVQSNVSAIANIFEQVGIAVGGALKIIIDLVSVIWEAGAAVANLVTSLLNLATLNFEAAAKNLEDMANNGRKIGASLTDAILKPGQAIDEVGKAAERGEARLKRIQDGLQKTQEIGTTAASEIAKKWVEASDAFDLAGDSAQSVDSKLESARRRQIDRHADPIQRDQLKELEEAAEEYEAKMKEALRQVNARVAMQLQKESADFEKSAMHTKYGFFETPESIAKRGKELKEQYSTDLGASEAEAKLKAFKEQIEELKKTIMNQALYSEVEKTAEAHEKFIRDTIQDAKKKYKAEKLERETFEKDIVSTAEKYYKEDLKKYEHAQEQKKKALEKLKKDTLKIEENYNERINKLTELENSAKLSGSAGDPARQRHIAQDQLQEAKEAIGAYLDKGGTSGKEFQTLIDNVTKAAEAIKDAEETISGADRAGKNLVTNLEEEKGYIEQLKKNQLAKNQLDIDAQNRKGPVAPSLPAEVRRAAQDVQKDALTRKEVIETNVHLEIDGTVSKATLNAIATAVRKSLEKDRRNQTDMSDYDKDSYGDTGNDSGDDL